MAASFRLKKIIESLWEQPKIFLPDSLLLSYDLLELIQEQLNALKQAYKNKDCILDKKYVESLKFYQLLGFWWTLTYILEKGFPTYLEDINYENPFLFVDWIHTNNLMEYIKVTSSILLNSSSSSSPLHPPKQFQHVFVYLTQLIIFLDDSNRKIDLNRKRIEEQEYRYTEYHIYQIQKGIEQYRQAHSVPVLCHIPQRSGCHMNENIMDRIFLELYFFGKREVYIPSNVTDLSEVHYTPHSSNKIRTISFLKRKIEVKAYTKSEQLLFDERINAPVWSDAFVNAFLEDVKVFLQPLEQEALAKLAKKKKINDPIKIQQLYKRLFGMKHTNLLTEWIDTDDFKESMYSSTKIISMLVYVFMLRNEFYLEDDFMQYSHHIRSLLHREISFFSKVQIARLLFGKEDIFLFDSQTNLSDMKSNNTSIMFHSLMSALLFAVALTTPTHAYNYVSNGTKLELNQRVLIDIFDCLPARIVQSEKFRTPKDALILKTREKGHFSAAFKGLLLFAAGEEATFYDAYHRRLYVDEHFYSMSKQIEDVMIESMKPYLVLLEDVRTIVPLEIQKGLVRLIAQKNDVYQLLTMDMFVYPVDIENVSLMLRSKIMEQIRMLYALAAKHLFLKDETEAKQFSQTFKEKELLENCLNDTNVSSSVINQTLSMVHSLTPYVYSNDSKEQQNIIQFFKKMMDVAGMLNKEILMEFARRASQITTDSYTLKERVEEEAIEILVNGRANIIQLIQDAKTVDDWKRISDVVRYWNEQIHASMFDIDIKRINLFVIAVEDIQQTIHQNNTTNKEVQKEMSTSMFQLLSNMIQTVFKYYLKQVDQYETELYTFATVSFASMIGLFRLILFLKPTFLSH